MKPAAAKEKSTSAIARARAAGPSRSYLQTRVRASRLLNAAHILAFIELSRRLHQAYRQAYDKQAAEWLLPQNPAPVPLDINKIQELLKNPTCNEFVTNLIKKAAELYPSNPAESSNAVDLFNAIKSQGGYILRGTTVDGKPAGGTTAGSIANNNATVYISPSIWPVPVPNANMVRLSQEGYALAGLHETIHLAGRFGYSDFQLARAAHELTGIEAHWPAQGTTNPFAWSRYWDDILKEKCGPARK